VILEFSSLIDDVLTNHGRHDEFDERGDDVFSQRRRHLIWLFWPEQLELNPARLKHRVC